MLNHYIIIMERVLTLVSARINGQVLSYVPIQYYEKIYSIKMCGLTPIELYEFESENMVPLFSDIQNQELY